MKKDLVWHKVAGLEDLPDGRVMSAKAGNRAIALSPVSYTHLTLPTIYSV